MKFPMPQNPPSSFNAASMDDAGRPRGKTMLILFDDSTIPSADIKKSRETAEAYVKDHMESQDLFAVASFGNDMKLLQTFTSDRDKVLQAIAQPALSMANPSRAAQAGWEVEIRYEEDDVIFDFRRGG